MNKNFKQVMKKLELWEDHEEDPDYEDGIDFGHIAYWQNIAEQFADEIVRLTKIIENDNVIKRAHKEQIT